MGSLYPTLLSAISPFRVSLRLILYVLKDDYVNVFVADCGIILGK